MSKHTPGPWRSVRSTGIVSSHRIVGSESREVGQGVSSDMVCAQFGDLDLPTPAANARLIAAAPDMLALLRDVARVSWHVPEIDEQVRLLLARIDGEAP